MFIDEARIYIKAGDGGKGCISFRREKNIPMGGPDGGDGGKGGSIYLVADENSDNLAGLYYHPHFKAKRGQHGQGSNKTGRNADDIEIKVPAGTLVRDKLTGEIMCDLVEHGQKELVAEGGRGGRGNARFVTSTFQAPRIAEDGGEGEEKELLLELKLLADVGLIGFPNAGKSSLLSRISAAHPKIADYPFTTLEPNLGVVRLNQTESYVAADIPGLIEKAHLGQGLGHKFLRSIERTNLLVHIMEIGEERDPIEGYEAINSELSLYSKDLGAKPQIAVINKLDLKPDEDKLRKLIEYFEKNGIEYHRISAVTGEGIKELNRTIYDSLKKKDLKEAEESINPDYQKKDWFKEHQDYEDA